MFKSTEIQLGNPVLSQLDKLALQICLTSARKIRQLEAEFKFYSRSIHKKIRKMYLVFSFSEDSGAEEHTINFKIRPDGLLTNQ